MNKAILAPAIALPVTVVFCIWQGIPLSESIGWFFVYALIAYAIARLADVLFDDD